MSKTLWITWEDHRRSRELAKEFKAFYVPLIFDSNRYLRYPILALRTAAVIFSKRPKVVFCQNPSIILAGILVFLKSLFGYYLVVDRHSNFKLEFVESNSIKWRMFHSLSRFTVRHADLTVVTNQKLKKLCDRIGGQSMVLQDKIPLLRGEEPRQRPSLMKHLHKYQVVAVTTFDSDEPIEEIVAASALSSDFVIYLTGNYRKRYSEEKAKALAEQNVILTGFIPDGDYLALMENSDLVVVLTEKDCILNCGAYEAISFGKPLILSDTPTLKEYFKGAAIYTLNDKENIYNKIEESLRKRQSRAQATTLAKSDLTHDWERRFQSVCEHLDKETIRK